MVVDFRFRRFRVLVALNGCFESIDIIVDVDVSDLNALLFTVLGNQTQVFSSGIKMKPFQSRNRGSFDFKP